MSTQGSTNSAPALSTGLSAQPQSWHHSLANLSWDVGQEVHGADAAAGRPRQVHLLLHGTFVRLCGLHCIDT